MATPYSQDLRDRVLRAYDRSPGGPPTPEVGEPMIAGGLDHEMTGQLPYIGEDAWAWAQPYIIGSPMSKKDMGHPSGHLLRFGVDGLRLTGAAWAHVGSRLRARGGGGLVRWAGHVLVIHVPVRPAMASAAWSRGPMMTRALALSPASRN